MSDNVERKKPTVEIVTRMSYTMNRSEIEEALTSWLVRKFQQFRGATFDFEDLAEEEIDVQAEKKKK